MGRLHDTGHSGWWVGLSLFLSFLRGLLAAMARHIPSLGLYLAVLVLAVIWFGVSITIFVFLVQPGRVGQCDYSRY